MLPSTKMMDLCNEVSEATSPIVLRLKEDERKALQWAVGRARAKKLTVGPYMVWWHNQKGMWIVFRFEGGEMVKAISKPWSFGVPRFLEKQRMARAIAKADLS